MLANQLQDGRTVSVRAVDDLTGAVVDEGARDAYALPADVQRAMLANKSTIYSGHHRAGHDRAFARVRYRARTGREETGANPLMLTLGGSTGSWGTASWPRRCCCCRSTSRAS